MSRGQDQKQCRKTFHEKAIFHSHLLKFSWKNLKQHGRNSVRRSRRWLSRRRISRLGRSCKRFGRSCKRHGGRCRKRSRRSEICAPRKEPRRFVSGNR